MAITVKDLKNQLDKINDDWLVGAYEGEGIGLVIKSPDFDWSKHDDADSTWIETGPPN